MLIRELKFLAIDCEATGLDPRSARLIELACAQGDAFESISSWTSLIDPKVKIPEKVVALTGISSELICNAPDESRALTRFFSQIKGVDTILGYFVSLDDDYLSCALLRNGLEILGREYFSLPRLCMKNLSRLLCPELGIDYDLLSLAKLLHVDKSNHHRAQADVEMTVGVWRKLCVRLEERGIVTLDQVLGFQGPIVRSPWEIPGGDESYNRRMLSKWQSFIAGIAEAE